VSILKPNTAPGEKLPAAGAVALPLRRGSRLCPSIPACVKIVFVVVLPRACQKIVAVLPWVWKASSWRMDTGLVVSTRLQYADRTSSPAVSMRP
jgi:hypothetical protein